MEPGAQRESDALIRSIQAEVGKLDFKLDDQWTQDGLPSVDYVAEAVKNPAVTREMLNAACPGYTRRSAEDLASF